MPHFTRRLSTEQGSLNFYFNRIYSAAGERYHVSVIERTHTLRTFYMQERFGRWMLIKGEDFTAWIEGIEQALEQQILDHLSKKY